MRLKSSKFGIPRSNLLRLALHEGSGALLERLLFFNDTFKDLIENGLISGFDGEKRARKNVWRPEHFEPKLSDPSPFGDRTYDFGSVVGISGSAGKPARLPSRLGSMLPGLIAGLGKHP